MAAKLARSQSASSSGTNPRSWVQIGELLAGKYRIERVIGEGGMGVVVAARHEFLDQVVAIKLLYNDVADPEAQSRLLLEARACARLQSDHVARVMDVDSGPDGLPFVVMELLEGIDLCRFLDTYGAMPSTLAVDYVLQALEGLAHAHVRGMVHRDLKPSNLFLVQRPDGAQLVKILDFGISKTNDVLETSLERIRAASSDHGRIVGSPPYMSPEQVRTPKSVDHRTDIWSLGICLYELLTQAMPFGGKIQDLFADIVTKDPLPMTALAPDVPPGLDVVVRRCLAKDPNERFTDVAELARALAPFGSGAWPGAPERIEATLSRGFESSGSNRSVEILLDGDRLAIPSSPRAVDSNQELFATASTVARRFAPFESRTLWLVGVPALLGVVIAGVSIYRATVVASEETTASAAREVPAASAPATPLPATVASPPATATNASSAASDPTSASGTTPARATKKTTAPSAPRSALPPGLPRDRR